MEIPAYSNDELKVVAETPEFPWMPSIKVYDYPISARDAVRSYLLDRKPAWQLIGVESQTFSPRIVPDAISRGWVFEAKPFDAATSGGGPDMFGIEWVYQPKVGGSMEKPGRPLMEDANDWPDWVKFPDVDSWDWEGSAKENNDVYLTDSIYSQAWLQTGWFERLISFMDFEEAIVAISDEGQQDAIKAFFDRLSDTYIDIIEHYALYFKNVGGFYIHDDWGSAQNTFFAPELVREMIVPYMRRVTDCLHDHNYAAELHSCGNNIRQVPNMILAGWDAWAPQVETNDIAEIYDKYGNQILISTVPPVKFDPATASEEEQRAVARAYVKRFCDPDKPSALNYIGEYSSMLTPTFREELYVQSRKRYSRS